MEFFISDSNISTVLVFPNPNSPPPKNRIFFLFSGKLKLSKISCLLKFNKNLFEIGMPVTNTFSSGMF